MMPELTQLVGMETGTFEIYLRCEINRIQKQIGSWG